MFVGVWVSVRVWLCFAMCDFLCVAAVFHLFLGVLVCLWVFFNVFLLFCV